MNDSFRLSLEIDPHKLNSDLLICQALQWKEHFNERDYDGSWTAISLRSRSGNAQDILAPDSDLPFIDTSLLAQCNYFRDILDAMEFEKETVRLLRLEPGSIIKEHRDMGLAYRYGCFRLHIPIVTDTTVLFTVGGKNIPMLKGECWYADFDLPHSVVNESPNERIHLIIDGKRNAWTDQWFAASGYDFEEERKKTDLPVETKKQMIQHLKEMKTQVAKDMILKLESEIQAILNAAKNES